MVSIKKWVTGGLTAGVLAVATAGMTPAWAGTTSAHLGAGHVAVRSDAAKPNSNIVGSGKKVKYSPTSLNVKWSGPTEKTCTAKKVSFTITNTAKTAEQVTNAGSDLGSPIPSGKALGICVWGSGTASGTLGIKANKKAVLTIHVS